MRIALVTIGYNLPGATERLVESARQGGRHELIFLLILHSQLPEKVREFDQLASQSGVTCRPYGVNRGLAKSWNEGVLWGYQQNSDAVMVVNEDITFAPGDVDLLAELALYRRDCHLVTGRAYHESEKRWASSEYGCFVLNPIGLSTLGAFDENFFPIYCEDADYRRRAALAGLSAANCPTTTIMHGGSQSLTDPAVAAQNSVTYSRNRAYFRRKWGGDGGGERFSRPFDDPRFTFYIDPAVCEAPYPGFNRDDQAIVQI